MILFVVMALIGLLIILPLIIREWKWAELCCVMKQREKAIEAGMSFEDADKAFPLPKWAVQKPHRSIERG